MKVVLPDEVHRASWSYLKAADRVLPGAVVRLAIGGSAALGAFRPGASDIDVIATLDDTWRDRSSLIPRLRALHFSQIPRLAGRAVQGSGFGAWCDTSFIWESDLSQPVTTIEPIASHVGRSFNATGAFDVNPVMWRQLLQAGVVLRGGELATWGLNPETHQLHGWIRKNIVDYWVPLLRRAEMRHGPPSAGEVEWCLLGPARMHATLRTGEIISKQRAGRWALDHFPEHEPILTVAHDYLHRDVFKPAPPRHRWRELTIACMREIITESERDCGEPCFK